MTAPSSNRGRRPRFSQHLSTNVHAPSSARSSGTEGPQLMSDWQRFLETFFNAKVMAKYWPDIAYGMLVTVELAVLVVISGLAAGLALALIRSLAIRPLNWLIIFVVDLFRALPPLVIIVLIYFGLPSVDV